MSSLLIKYQSADKKEKGRILDDLAQLTREKYPTVRNRILNESFSYGDRKLIAEFYNISLEELFPEPVKITQI